MTLNSEEARTMRSDRSCALWFGYNEGSLQDIVFQLIQKANASGWVEKLICAARNNNPGNPKLKDIAEELLPNN